MKRDYKAFDLDPPIYGATVTQPKPYPSASAASANYASAAEVQSLIRSVAAHQRHLAAHDEQLASGGRMFDAIERHLTTNFQLICMLWIAVVTAIVLAVTL